MDNTELKNQLNNEYEKLEQSINNLINTITDENQDVIQQVIKKLTTRNISIKKNLKLLEEYEAFLNKLVNKYNVNL
jgi:phospholipid N-methyltransferase